MTNLVELYPKLITDDVYTFEFTTEQLSILNLGLKTLKTQREISLRCITKKRLDENQTDDQRRSRKKKSNMVLLTTLAPPPLPEPIIQPVVNHLEEVVKAAEVVKTKVKTLRKKKLVVSNE